MKLQKQATLFVVLMILLLVNSCKESNVSVEAPTPESHSTQLPTIVRVTQTTPISTVFTTSSPTAIASLPVDEARSQLLDLLENNGDCELPCFWDVTPGKSSLQDASTILMPLASISEFTSFKPGVGTIYPDYYLENDLQIKVNISLLAEDDNQLVNSVSFIAGLLKREGNVGVQIFDSPYLREHLNYYMLPNILTQYGEPSTVMVSTMAKLSSSGVPGGFKLLLLYPERGMLVNYTMQMQIKGDSIMGCPSNSHMEFRLYPSDEVDTFFDQLDQSGWAQIIQNTYKPIDKATSITKEDFYRTFAQQTNQCIQTPANLWPIPN